MQTAERTVSVRAHVHGLLDYVELADGGLRAFARYVRELFTTEKSVLKMLEDV